MKVTLFSLSIAVLVTGAVAAAEPVRLVTDLPQPAANPIDMSGEHKILPPIVDEAGNAIVAWQVISGAVDSDLVETLFVSKVSAAGAPALGTVPKVLGQVFYQILQRQAAGVSAVAPDGKGGAYYLWDAYVLHIGEDGSRAWPIGNLYKGKTGDLWRFPSQVRITTNYEADIGRVRFFADGTGNAVAAWSECCKSPNAMRAQKFGPDGKVLWGTDGVLINDAGDDGANFGAAVPDGKGGLVALLSWGKKKKNDPWFLPDHKAKVRFLSANGTKVKDSPMLPISARDYGLYKVAADGLGGIYILESRRPEGGGQHTMHLTRVDSNAKVVFDKVLATEEVPDEEFDIWAEPDGTALASWRFVKKPANPDEADPTLDVYFARVSAKGQLAWAKPAMMVLPTKVGPMNIENSPRFAMITAGAETVVAFENLVEDKASTTGVSQCVWKQRIDAKGAMALPGVGEKLSSLVTYAPYLVRMNGKVGAFFFGGEPAGKVPEFHQPFFLFL